MHFSETSKIWTSAEKHSMHSPSNTGAGESGIPLIKFRARCLKGSVYFWSNQVILSNKRYTSKPQLESHFCMWKRRLVVIRHTSFCQFYLSCIHIFFFWKIILPHLWQQLFGYFEFPFLSWVWSMYQQQFTDTKRRLEDLHPLAIVCETRSQDTLLDTVKVDSGEGNKKSDNYQCLARQSDWISSSHNESDYVYTNWFACVCECSPSLTEQKGVEM